MKTQHVCILGGTGFVGRHLVARLVKAGCQVRVLTRRRETHRELLVLPSVDLIEANINNAGVLAQQFRHMDAVINLVGILNEGRRKGRRFEDVHVELPRCIVDACQSAGVTRLLHMSALKADAETGPSRYLRTKGEGEALVLDAENLNVSCFRPSVIFGSDDQFFNRFASLLAMSPLIFPLACANARFAPVYVEDVARAFVRALDNPATFGQSYELCGPKPYTLRELVEYTAAISGHRRRIIGLGNTLSWWQGLIMEKLPLKPFSRDNYLSTRVDSLCQSCFPAVFDITPASIEAIVPGYLGEGDANARFSAMRRKARRD